MSSAPQYVMGTQGWGTNWTSENVAALVDRLNAAGIKHYDTARLYPASRPGESEKLLGSVRQPEFVIDSKILFRPGALRRDQMEESLLKSLEELGTTKVKTLYAHAPDKDTSIADQAANFDHFYKSGYFEQLGLCNYSPAQLTEYIETAKSKGYVVPTVYQGQYNIFCRHYETDLFPLIRKLGLTFVANSPLAGGFATGKLTFAREPQALEGTRFEAAESNILGYLYRMWYDKPGFHEAIHELSKSVGQHEGQVSSLAQVAIRWILFHSALRDTDHVAIGPSSLAQLEEYLSARDSGPLPEELVKQIYTIYEPIREDAAPLVQAGWWSF